MQLHVGLNLTSTMSTLACRSLYPINACLSPPAAAGMGRATVLAMHRLGAQVITCDVDHAALASLPDEVQTHVCDVSDPDQVDALMTQITPEGLDILVNNAGIGGPTKAVEDVSNDEWRQTMGVCIDGQFYCARRAVPVFKAQGHGVIINLVSAAGILGFPNRAPMWRPSGR